MSRRSRRAQLFINIGRAIGISAVMMLVILSGSDLVIRTTSETRPIVFAGEESIFLEPGDDHWAGWDVFKIDVDFHPRESNGPLGLVPEVRGVKIMTTVLAWKAAPLPQKVGDNHVYEVDVGALWVHLPSSASDVAPTSEELQRVTIDHAIASLGYKGREVTILPISGVVPDEGMNADGSRYSVYPTIGFSDIPVDDDGNYMQFAIYQLEMDASGAYAGGQGLAKSLERIVWAPARSTTEIEVGNVTGVTVSANGAGLVGTSPASFSQMSDGTLWDDMSYKQAVIYELVTSNWVTKIVGWSDIFVVPAVVGLVVSYLLSRRSRQQLAPAGTGKHRKAV